MQKDISPARWGRARLPGGEKWSAFWAGGEVMKGMTDVFICKGGGAEHRVPWELRLSFSLGWALAHDCLSSVRGEGARQGTNSVHGLMFIPHCLMVVLCTRGRSTAWAEFSQTTWVEEFVGFDLGAAFLYIIFKSSFLHGISCHCTLSSLPGKFNVRLFMQA